MDFSPDVFTCSAPTTQGIRNYTISLSDNITIQCAFVSDPAPVVTMGTNWQRSPLVTMEPSDAKFVTATSATYTLQNVSCPDLGKFDDHETNCCFITLFHWYYKMNLPNVSDHNQQVKKSLILKSLNLNCVVVTCNQVCRFRKNSHHQTINILFQVFTGALLTISLVTIQ